jgi:two-component system nitrate/nitrite response regulator NarL
LGALLQHSPYKVIASAGRASDLKDIHSPSDRQPLAILTIDDTECSPAEAVENVRTLRTRLAAPIIVIVAETRNPVDIRHITSLAPNGYIANLASREVLLKVLELSVLARSVLVLSSVAATASLSERLVRPEPLDTPGGNGHNPPDNTGRDARDVEGPLFSEREKQILRQLARGSSNKEIARLFSITESTVKVHLKALLRKIGARNRTQAAIWAVNRKYFIASSPAQRVEHSLHPVATDLPAVVGV